MGRKSYSRKNLAGLRLREKRESLGLSQDDLARRCQLFGWDVDRLTITRIEGGNRLLCDYEFMILASVMQIHVLELIPTDFDLIPYLMHDE